MTTKRSAKLPISNSTKSANKERVRFIFEPDRHSPNGITFTWLIHKTYNGKEKAAIATRSFWLPFAYRDNGTVSAAELKELAQQSIWRLEEQIQSLRESFGLESAPQIVGASSLPQSLNQPPVVDRVGSDRSLIPSVAEHPVPFSSTQFSPLADDLLSEFGDAL